MSSSRPFQTRITTNNKVEFIFEGINLPFDNAYNDGFVAFRIKTKPTLTIGNSFSNSASIYFDFNLPIVTNTATSTIQLLRTQAFDSNGGYSLFPNPTSGIVNIKNSQNIAAVSATVYNMLGQQLQTDSSENGIKTIDISSFASGSYIIEIRSAQRKSRLKFFKN